jgi:eukaryotic-like serine/threonine-protein kinase
MQAVMGAGRLIGGRYRLQDPIGRGAMGIVWRGRDELLDRDVAVKEVQVTGHATPAEAEVVYQRTLREARTAARLSHPNVVKVFDVVEEAGSPWIIMELVEARSLDRVITEDGPLPPEQAADLGTGLICALAAAHASGVLHRDVKPSNVLVTKDGRAVLTDFGIATFAEDLGLTQAGMVVGTPGFTAPERIRGDIATPASDLWSLGATLYAAVEGRGPFDRVGGSSVIAAGVAGEDAPRAQSAGPLGPVIDALLSRDPGTRPDAATAERLLADAATEARTGPRPLTGGWLAAEAGREHGSADAPTTPPADAIGADSGFLDPPDYKVLRIPASDPGPLSSDSSDGSSEWPPVGAALAGGAAAGVGAAAAAGAGSAGAGSAGAAGAAGAAVADDRAQAGGALGPAVASASQGPEPTSVVDPSSGPVLWGPVRSGGPAGTPPGALSEPGSGDAGAGVPGQGGPGPGSGGPGGRFSGRWRLMVAAGGIAALIVAALVTWNIFQHSGASALGSSTPQGQNLTAGAGSSPSAGGQSSSHPSASPRGGSAGRSAGGTSSAHGSKPTTGHSGSGPSGRPSVTPSTSSSGSGSPSPSSSPTPSPSTSTPTGPTLPPGYRWHKFTALQMAAVAGFKIGMPDAWTQSISIPVAAMNDAAYGFHLDVNLSYWLYAGPLNEAQYLQSLAATAHKGHAYKELLISKVNFDALGGFRSATAAELKYSWKSVALGYNVTELIVLVTLDTTAGSQPYEFELTAPTANWGTARAIMTTALPTFRPLPS